MGKYFSRALRYFLYLVIIWAVVLTLLLVTGYASVGVSDLNELFASNNFLILVAVVLVFSALYPKLGYVYKTIPTISNRTEMEEMFEKIGLYKFSEQNGLVTYRYKSTFRRVIMRFDDEIVIQFGNDFAIIDCNKSMLARVWRIIENVSTNN